MSPKIIISVIVGVLLSSAAVVTLAAVGGDGGPSGVGEETPIATDVTGTPTDVGATPTEVGATPTDVGPTPTLVDDLGTITPTPTATPEDDGDEDGDEDGPRDITGIPDDNPNFVPDDDGECERGETREMITPGGHVVVVPCHVVDQHDEHQDDHPGNGHGPPASDD